MTTKVLVLFHPGDKYREKVWAFCRQRWTQAGFSVREGFSPHGLFAARNVAADTNWDVAVFADADMTMAEPERVREAVEQAQQGRYVSLYERILVLDKKATRNVLSGQSLLTQEPVETLEGCWIGPFAICRDLWEAVGGYDERFAGRAGQDVAFLMAAATLGDAPQSRLLGSDCYHLWHPPPVGRVFDTELMPLYQDALGDRVAMAKLVRR